MAGGGRYKDRPRGGDIRIDPGAGDMRMGPGHASEVSHLRATDTRNLDPPMTRVSMKRVRLWEGKKRWVEEEG